ncbi:MAG: hypothetical protein ACRCWI_07715 [Brevinema sp.]
MLKQAKLWYDNGRNNLHQRRYIMYENLKRLLENSSEEELKSISESMDKHLQIACENDDKCKDWIPAFQEIIDEFIEQNFRPADAVYELICENSKGTTSEEGTLSELISDNRGWLESYLPSKHKSRVYNISSIEELVELLNLSYEGTYWSDTEYSFDLV